MEDDTFRDNRNNLAPRCALNKYLLNKDQFLYLAMLVIHISKFVGFNMILHIILHMILSCLVVCLFHSRISGFGQVDLLS